MAYGRKRITYKGFSKENLGARERIILKGVTTD
jgi:hypothetical protein